MTKVSVVIPVRNGEATLEKCLNSIRSQTIRDIEILILDSMSEDKSREIAEKFNARIIDVPKETFNHGLTRNVGVQNATGNLIYMTVQDAWLSQNDLLEKMMKHFDDEEVMAVGGHQATPHEKDKNPVLWYKKFSESQIVIREISDVEDFKKTSQKYHRSMIAWDDVVAMYRKTALTSLPFVETQFAEDWIWSRDALLKGWRLIYDPSIVVYHYHHSGYHYSYKVAFTLNYHFYKFFDYKPGIPNLFLPMAKATYHLSKNSQLSTIEKLYWVFHNCKIRVGIFNSHVNFLFHHFIGGTKSVERRYNKVCRKIPQGKQKH